jgi:hypothetical protein
MAAQLDLVRLKAVLCDDLAKTESTYTHWYGYNQWQKNWLFIASVITGAGTAFLAVILEGTTLKIWAALFGTLSTIAAALQRFARVGAKAEFYGGQVKEIHVLRLKTHFVTTEPELLEIVGKYQDILLAEGKLSRDQDDNKALNDEIADLKKSLKEK